MEEKIINQNAINKFIRFMKSRLSLRQGTDYSGTLEDIEANTVFKGPSVWILICSIFIASVGLNLNSTAVIIGAMLISPLMGPIIGLGTALATRNIPLLRKSLKNFIVMVGISLISSWIYFYFTPLSEAQSELFARTQPTLLDVMVAWFGGMAGIIAGSRSERNSVIPGVAIATALMPPLCTAGYGLATLNMSFFFGAFYLFLLNSIFICLATALLVRYLKFPMASFIDSVREKRMKRWITVITVLIVAPSVFIFVGIVQESLFKSKANVFMQNNMQFENTQIVSSKINYNDTLSTIEIFLIGEILPDSRIQELKNRLSAEGLEKTRLKINQAKDESSSIAGRVSAEVKSGIIEEMYKKNEEHIQLKEEKIRLLENEIARLHPQSIEFVDLQAELLALYPDIESFSYSNMIVGQKIGAPDTVLTFLVHWVEASDESMRDKEKLRSYLQARFKQQKIRVLEEN